MAPQGLKTPARAPFPTRTQPQTRRPRCCQGVLARGVHLQVHQAHVIVMSLLQQLRFGAVRMRSKMFTITSNL